VVSLALGLAAVLGAGAGCYQTPQPACAFACARDGSCPSGYACDPQDQICHRELAGGALEACEETFRDAASPDARLDASPLDAAVDAPTDAATDAP
jgi:hypothetical protein